MKEIIKYEACDGVIFNQRDKCAEYEDNLLKKRLRICNIEFWNENRRNMLHPLITDKYYDTKIDMLFFKCSYVNITEDISVEIQKYIRHMWGWEIPYIKGIYRYNFDKDEWIRET